MDSFAARQACRDGRYDEVLAMYGKAAPDGSWTCWDYYYYAYALRKTKQYRKGREIARAGMIAFPDFTNLHGIYCWCLYYLLYPEVRVNGPIRRLIFAALSMPS